MIITGAFLADNAAVVDGKLHVWGGVLDHGTVGEDRKLFLSLVVLTQGESDESADNVVRLEIRKTLVDYDTDPTVILLPVPDETLRNEIGFAYWSPLGFELPEDGRYVLIVSCGGGTVSLPLTIYS